MKYIIRIPETKKDDTGKVECVTCSGKGVNIKVPEFKSVSKKYAQLNHPEFKIQLICRFCPACGKPIKKKKGRR